jgi:3-oxoacyl-[acyl-carrier-protein] synthase-3
MSAKKIGAKILGVGSYVPPRRVLNDDLKQYMDTTDEWIVQRTGIKQRYWVEGKTDTSDLAVEATKRALENANVSKEEIEMIVFATLSPDCDFPGGGCFLQAKMGMPGIAALDIRQQCSGMYKKVLVVGAEVHSKGLDKTTRGRDVAVLFGDGAGAVVMGATEVNDPLKDSYFLSTHLHADGNFAKELWVRAPGSAYEESRFPKSAFEAGDHFPIMNGKHVFMHAVKRMPEAILESLKANNLSIEQVDLFLFHQANLRINEMVAKQLGIPESKIFNTIDRFANTTAATIPIGMDEAVKAGKLKKGMLVASAAFGSGFTWGSALFRR